jgi:hypothetical protein
MEAKHGFPATEDRPGVVSAQEFQAGLRDGRLYRDAAFESRPGNANGVFHGVQSHRIQWWCVMHAIEQRPAAFGGVPAHDLFQRMALVRWYWPRVFDNAETGVSDIANYHDSLIQGIGLW